MINLVSALPYLGYRIKIFFNILIYFATELASLQFLKPWLFIDQQRSTSSCVYNISDILIYSDLFLVILLTINERQNVVYFNYAISNVHEFQSHVSYRVRFGVRARITVPLCEISLAVLVVQRQAQIIHPEELIQ